jgi:hypothetical protein
MWTYKQSTGELLHNNIHVGVGYSGHGSGVNNPLMENVPCVGPIPRGTYTIGSFFTDHIKGPLVAHLTPLPGTELYNRSGFMMHGDNAAMNDSASEGCIIMAHTIRQQVAQSGDHDLTVAA